MCANLLSHSRERERAEKTVKVDDRTYEVSAIKSNHLGSETLHHIKGETLQPIGFERPVWPDIDITRGK